MQILLYYTSVHYINLFTYLYCYVVKFYYNKYVSITFLLHDKYLSTFLHHISSLFPQLFSFKEYCLFYFHITSFNFINLPSFALYFCLLISFHQVFPFFLWYLLIAVPNSLTFPILSWKALKLFKCQFYCHLKTS